MGEKKHEIFSDVLDELSTSGGISSSDAERLRAAKRYVLPIREALAYLACAVMLIGLGFAVSPAFRDSSAVAIALVLCALGAACSALAFRFRDDRDWKRPLSEVLEIAATVAFSSAACILLIEAGVTEQIAVLIPALLSAVWGLGARVRSRFSWAIMFTAGLLATTFSLVAWWEPHHDISTLIFLAAAVCLIFVGTRNARLAVLPRMVGSFVYAVSSFSWFGNHESIAWTLVVIGVAVAIFAVVSSTQWADMLIASALVAVVGLVVLALRLVQNTVARGVVLLAIGGATLTAIGLYSRRRQTCAADGSSAT